MRSALHGGRGLGSALLLAVGAVLAVASLQGLGAAAHAAPSASQAGDGCAPPGHGRAHVGRIGGVVHAERTGCRTRALSEPATGTPPLIFHGGPVMGTRSTGPVVVTPIYWNPTGHPIPTGYQRIINTYLKDVAADSGAHTNVYSTLNAYFGSNGDIRYRIRFGTPVNDSAPLPASGCRLNGQDKKGIYADSSGYDACLDDDQVIAETDRVVSARGLPRDYGHIYVTFLPKHVESCFYAGSTTTASNFCTINHQPSAAYCAYHSQAPSGTVYANMPFPVYESSVGYTCASDATFDAIQTPNGDVDADTEISPTSHEIMEAITDPDTVTGWFDSSGYENGDECAYVYGATQGTNGQLYNQVINHRHYLTQEEFSNRDFAKTGRGCLQSE